MEKPWLDDGEFRGLVREKGELYSRKLRGGLDEEGRQRLVEVVREVNRMRRRLKRAYFDQRLGEITGDLRRTWEVLGEALWGRQVKRGASFGAVFSSSMRRFWPPNLGPGARNTRTWHMAQPR